MNIQALARRTGIPAATLRKWEERYRVLEPARTAGSHRRYSERDVLRVEWLKARLEEGYRIGEAAQLLRTTGAAATDPAGLAEELVASALAADPARTAGAIEQAFALFPVARVVRDVVRPALRRIGDLWEAGRLSAADEHHVTEVVRAKLRALVNVPATGPRGTTVLCCVPRERHEVGLLATAVLLHADGWRVAYLGADTPLADAAAFARRVEAPVLGVSATVGEHRDAAATGLDEVARAGIAVVRGGAAYADEEPDDPLVAFRELARR